MPYVERSSVCKVKCALGSAMHKETLGHSGQFELVRAAFDINPHILITCPFEEARLP